MAKQGRLPGMENPSIPDLDAKAEAYRKARNSRMRMLEKEVEARDILQAAMKDHKLKYYEYEDQIVVLDVQEKVKVKSKGEESNGEADEE